MIETDSNHYRLVAGSLAGEREVDEQTFASLAVLSERLEQLKGRNEAFAGVEFSDAAKKLRTSRPAVAVG